MEALFDLVDAGFPDGDGVATHPGATVISPYGEAGVGQIAREGPLAGQVAFAQVNLAAEVDDTESGLLGEAIRDHAPAWRASRSSRAGSTSRWWSRPRPS